MQKDDRIYAGFPIEMDEHPKIIGLSDAAFRAMFEAVFYARRMENDGFLDERVVLKRWGREVVDELTTNDPEKPSWVRVESPRPGWGIHDFLKHHPSKAEIDERRARLSQKRSAAGSKGAASRWQVDGKPMANHDKQEQEQEQEQEQKQEPSTSLVIETKRLSADESADAGTLIPDSWRPNQQHIDKAASLHLDVNREQSRFRDHAIRTQRRMKNWNAAFTNWLKKGAEMNQQRQGRPATQPMSKATQNAANYLREFGDDTTGGLRAIDA